ncbi:unnamed protein product [Ixodes hexagonus]
MPLFGKKKRDSELTSQVDGDGDGVGVSGGHSPTANGGSPTSAGGGNAAAAAGDPHSKNVPKPKLVFHCQQAQGSPTGIISGFSNIKELYLKIAECYDFPATDIILFCTLNTHKVDMARLLGGQIGLDDFIFVHRRGQPKEVEVLKGEDSLGLTITDNGAGLAFIKRIKEGSLMDRIGFVQVRETEGRRFSKEQQEVSCTKWFDVATLKQACTDEGTPALSVEGTPTLRQGGKHGSRKWQIAGTDIGRPERKKSGERKQTKGSASEISLILILQPDNVIQAAVDKINALLESYMGINDSELATQIWELGCERPNPHEFVTAVADSDLDAFGFTEDFLFDIWGAIGDARSGRLPAKDHAARTDL